MVLDPGQDHRPALKWPSLRQEDFPDSPSFAFKRRDIYPFG